MSRRVRCWLLVAWATVVAAAVPLLLWGATGVRAYVSDSGRYVSASNASVTGDLVVVAAVTADRVARVRAAIGGLAVMLLTVAVWLFSPKLRALQ